jgi:hypothetical protein
MLKPTYDAVKEAYNGPEYLANHFNCPGVVNQCAIRMSVALQRCGFVIEGFHNPRRIHGTELRHCEFNMPHIVGATELMEHLIKSFGLTRRYRGHEVKSAYKDLQDWPSIVYFHNLGGGKTDHIDLFNGIAIYNELRDYRDHGHMGGNRKTHIPNIGQHTKNHYFGRAQRIDFIEL